MTTAIANYTPDLPPDEWATINEFVRAAVADCMGHVSYSPRELFKAVTRHVWWCWRTAGLPLERAVVFHPEVIGEFIDHGCPDWSRPTAANRRSLLLRMSEQLMPPGSRPVRLPPMWAARPLPPYPPADVAALRSWAVGQITQTRVVQCHVLLALGFGAGLSAAEVADLRTGHLHVDSDGVLVEVIGRRARLVPVLAEWEAVLADLADAAMRPDLYVFGGPRRIVSHKNTVSNFVRATNIGRVQPSLQRMRVTWIVGHLIAGSPVKALMQAAGVDSLDALNRYLRFVPDADVKAYRRAFRSGVGGPDAQ